MARSDSVTIPGVLPTYLKRTTKEKEEGRRKKEKKKKEEGRRKKEEGRK